MEYSRKFFDSLRQAAAESRKNIPSFQHLIGKSTEIIFVDQESDKEHTGRYHIIDYNHAGIFALENDRGICLIDIGDIRYLCVVDDYYDVGF